MVIKGDYRAFQVELVVKNPPTNAGDVRDAGLISGLGRLPGGGHDNPLQGSCLENPHGQRSLAGYSPWGCKESSTTEQQSTAQNSEPCMQPGLGAIHLWLWFSILRNGNNREMQTLGPYLRPAESDPLG